MGVAISVKILKKCLFEADEIKDFPHPQNLLKYSTDGVKYLFENVYLDLLINKKHNTGHLNYGSFNIEDVYDLYNFCIENCTHINSEELTSLWKIYSDCFYTQPMKKEISFV